MEFFLYQVVARAVGLYLCIDCARKLRAGYLERKIADFNPDIVNWFLLGRQVSSRDTAPIRYWIDMILQATAFVGCLALAILGWHPVK